MPLVESSSQTLNHDWGMLCDQSANWTLTLQTSPTRGYHLIMNVSLPSNQPIKHTLWQFNIVIENHNVLMWNPLYINCHFQWLCEITRGIQRVIFDNWWLRHLLSPFLLLETLSGSSILFWNAPTFLRVFVWSSGGPPSGPCVPCHGHPQWHAEPRGLWSPIFAGNAGVTRVFNM